MINVNHELKTKTCGCGKTMMYSTHNHAYNCECGRCYNAVGQELAPYEDWKEEFDEGDDY